MTDEPSQEGSHTIIAFDEGLIPPEGSYGFELDLRGQSGCDVLENMVWLVRSLKGPYEVRANQKSITPSEIGGTYTTVTVWTDDQENGDFLMLVHELGVEVLRSWPPRSAD